MSATKSNTPYCSVCFAAGKKVAEYTSHYVRDARGGKTICPTILSQQCNYCKKPGHTPSCCPALAGKYVKNYKPTSAPAPTRTEVPVPTPAPTPAPVKKNKNQTYMLRMATLIEEEEQAEEQAEQRKEQAEQQKQQAEQQKQQAEATRLKQLNENFPTIHRNTSTIISTPLNTTSKKGSWATMAAKPAIIPAPIPAPMQDEDYFARPNDSSTSWF